MVAFPKCEPFNRKFQKFLEGKSNRMEILGKEISGQFRYLFYSPQQIFENSKQCSRQIESAPSQKMKLCDLAPGRGEKVYFI